MTPLKSNLNYEPPQEVKRLWKNTYSLSTLYNGVTLPGLIKTNHYYFHLIGVMLVLMGEFYGWFTVSSVSNDYDFIFIVLILIDCAVIIPIFKLNGKIKLIKNRLIVTDTEFEKEKLKNRKTNARLWLLFWKALLFSIALIKIFYLYKVNYTAPVYPTFYSIIKFNISKVELWPLTAVYLLVAIIHSFISSYFFGHLILTWKIRNGEKEHENITGHRTELLPENTEFVGTDTKSGTNKHYITKKVFDPSGQTLVEDPNDKTKNRFKLHTWGVLTDDQLDKLVWAQENAAIRRELSLICLKHQLAQIGE